MITKIERKFLLDGVSPAHISSILYDRYFLFHEQGTQIRIQQKGERYEFERKIRIDALDAHKEKLYITKQEFDFFKKTAFLHIQREIFLISQDPKITVVRYSIPECAVPKIEVEFKNRENADLFIPPDWFGLEITGDSSII